MASPSINDATIEKLIRQGIPGFDEDWVHRTQSMLNKIRPLQNQTKPAVGKADLAKLKYAFLIQVTRNEKLLFSKEVAVLKKSKQIKSELLKEKLLELEDGTLTISAKGRRFMTDFEKKQYS